jgi:hypothetical protein
MKKVAILLVSFLFFSVSFVNATNEETATVENAVMTTSISGKVFDKITGEALAGVKLTVAGSEKSVYSDFDGNFEIDGVQQGNIELAASYISYKNKVELVNIDLSKSNRVNIKIESISE